MIKINDLTFFYNKNNPIFSNINLNVKMGNIYGLLGENGVGKTTLLRLICGLLFPNSGNCKTFDADTKKRTPSMLEKIYYLPEVFNPQPIKPNEYANIYGKLYPNFSYKNFTEYLQIFSIDTKKKMKEFSYGQQKKTMIAFALACKTPLLLMDEPTNGLDIPSKTIFRQLISNLLNENTTFIISTHQVKDLENMIDPIIILEQNQILLNNSVAEITNKLQFVIEQQPSNDALYCEQTNNGYLCVKPNNNNVKTPLNIEALFNTAIKNKEYFMNNFLYLCINK
ncbi:MAG: ABC transporter ATP-binding protein [Bacteroidetes bacterium]|nr:ABC transporter ATP-binding protein [Bacteroidota bacterium]